MNLNNFTIKSQDTIQKAATIAETNQNQAIENGHLFKALLSEVEDVMSFLLKKLNVNITNVEKVIGQIVESYPKVTGGEPYFSTSANNSIQKAIAASKQMGDQFVSVEHLLSGILNSNDNVAQILKDSGVTESDLQKAINDLRKGSKVTSQSGKKLITL